MGVSSDGILVFGIDLGEDLPEFLQEFKDDNDGDGDFDNYLVSIAGMPVWGEEGHDFGVNREYVATTPVQLAMYCSYDYPMYILAVRGTEKNVSRGYVTEITSLEVDADKVTAYKEWLTERGIEGEPKWLLCSMYG